MFYAIFICSLLSFSMPCRAMDSEVADTEAMDIELGTTPEIKIEFKKKDFANAKTLFFAIQREIQKCPQNSSNYLGTIIPTALREALSSYKKDITQLFDPDWGNRRITVLHIASWANNDIDMVIVLINTLKGKQLQKFLRQTDVHQYSALHFAGIEGNVQIAKLILMKIEGEPDILWQRTEGPQSRNDLIGWETPEESARRWGKVGYARFLKAAEEAFYAGEVAGFKEFVTTYELTEKDFKTGCCCFCCPIL